MSAIRGLEETEPGVASLNRVWQAGKIDRSIVVCTREQMQRIPRRRGNRWFILTLEKRITVGKCLARNHVDVATGNLRVYQRGPKRGCSGQRQGQAADSHRTSSEFESQSDAVLCD